MYIINNAYPLKSGKISLKPSSYKIGTSDYHAVIMIKHKRQLFIPRYNPNLKVYVSVSNLPSLIIFNSSYPLLRLN